MNTPHPGVTRKNGVVVRVLDTGTAFVTTFDTDEQAMIPRSVNGRLDVQEGDILDMVVIPSNLHREDPSKAPWLVIKARVAEGFDWDTAGPAPTPQPDAPVVETERHDPFEAPAEEIRKEVLELVTEEPGLWTRRSVTDTIHEDYEIETPERGSDLYNQRRGRVEYALLTLHESGHLARVKVYTDGGKVRSGWDYFTAHPKRLGVK